MSDQQRPWPYIYLGPSFDGSLRAPVYILGNNKFDEYYVNSHRPKFGSQYNEALESILNKLENNQRKFASSIRDAMLAGGFWKLLILSTVVYDSAAFLGCTDEDIKKILHLKHFERYKSEMLRYRNQIPLQVLEAIVSVHKPELQPLAVYNFVIDLILRFLSMPPFKEARPQCFHILDVYRKSFLRHAEPYNLEQTNYEIPPFIPSATKLQEARIGITPSSTFSLSFNKKALSLPQILLDDHTESNFHNLIEFERLDRSAGRHFSWYLYIMFNLLKEYADVNLLKDRGIIKTIWNEDKVIELLKGLYSYADLNPQYPMDPYLLNLGQQLGKRYNKNLEGWRKDLFQTYLKSPWAIISLFAAFLILSLTVIQTVYTVLGYYKS